MIAQEFILKNGLAAPCFSSFTPRDRKPAKAAVSQRIPISPATRLAAAAQVASGRPERSECSGHYAAVLVGLPITRTAAPWTRSVTVAVSVFMTVSYPKEDQTRSAVGQLDGQTLTVHFQDLADNVAAQHAAAVRAPRSRYDRRLVRCQKTDRLAVAIEHRSVAGKTIASSGRT